MCEEEEFMKRFLGHCMAGVTVLVAAAAAAPACVHNDTSVFIHSVKAPPTKTGLDICEYTNDPTGAALSTGVLDVAFRQTYDAYLLVGSQLASKGSVERNRTESNRVLLQGATVRVTDSAGTEISSFTRLGTGVIEPGTGTLPSFGVFSTVLIDPTAIAYVSRTLQPNTKKRLVAFVRVFGETLGGVSVESNEFEYPVDVCYRCLVKFTSDTVDKALALTTGHTNCKATAVATATSLPCFPGQDQDFLCTSCPDLDVCDPTYDGTPQSAGTVQNQTPADAGGGG